MSLTRINALGYVLIETRDTAQWAHFLHVDNPRHHSLAVYQDRNPAASGCMHLMFEVPNLDQLGLFMDRCRSHNYAPLTVGSPLAARRQLA